MSSSTGTVYRVTTFGESHGPGIGVVIDGCPANFELDLENIQHELKRRRPGQSKLTTPRNEPDEFEILSGFYNGKTLGTSLAFFVRNTDMKSTDYDRWSDVYRPSHADFTYHAKYTHRTPHGGGRASVRESIARVIAGSVAGQILKKELNLETIAWVDSVGNIDADGFQEPPLDRNAVDESPVRCHNPNASRRMTELIEQVKKDGDSVGGTIGVIVNHVPPGLGDPVFDKLEADLAKACLSIPACKGFESGSGFSGTRLRGSQHNDPFYLKPDQAKSPIPSVQTPTNFSGGIQGGISNGMPILLRLAFKPTATIRKNQNTVNEKGEEVILKAGGRHDPCVLPRAVPIVESMVNMVLMDAYLRQRALQPEWYKLIQKDY
ncbi:MAG: chorismate synthase [Spirochaetia bacterium]|nr:chorismate synthase [Spirochaetia bacterium]